MEKDKKDYEIGAIYKITTPEGSNSLVLDILKQYGAEVTVEGPVSKIKLAYPIKKEAQAYFGYVQFKALPSDITKIHDDLRMNVEVLRHLLITDPVTKSASSEAETDSEKSAERPASKRRAAEPAVLSNEALEEKLEEMLK